MSWRLARSLVTLRDEIRALHPGTTVWTVGDAAHRATWSDHNPNASGVVCAIDVLGDGGLDLVSFAEHVRASGHPAFKYAIFDRRIASKGGGWRSYSGSNPHTSHVHVSVGVGPDGRSTGPYDDTSPWGLRAVDGPQLPGGILRRGDSGLGVRLLQAALGITADGIFGPQTEAALKDFQRRVGITVDGVFGPETRAALREELDMPSADEIAEAVWKRQNPTLGISYGAAVRYILNGTRPERAQTPGERLGVTAEVDRVAAQLEGLTAAIGGQDVAAAVRAELDRHRAALVDELAEDLGAAVAAELRDVPAATVEAAVARVLSRARVSVDEQDA